MITVSKHQKVVRQLQAMSARENDTFSELNRDKEKVKKVQFQLDGALEKIKEFFSIYYDIVACISPATNYTLFLRVKSIRVGKPFEFTVVSSFVSFFKEQEDGVQYFMCEIYLHNFILGENRKQNPNPFTRGI
jgi:hypothetical protein